MRTPITERFWRYVSPEPNTGCWLWDGAMLPNGYASISRPGYGTGSINATHVSLAAHGRPRPGKKWDACHTCDVRLCVNPDHLYWGTRLDNMRDAVKRGQLNRGMRNGMSKLTDADVIAIRASLLTQSAIAAEYGISQSLVSMVKTRKWWKHV